LSGTSMAAPHVSGVAALVWSAIPDATNNEVRDALIKTAQDLGAWSRCMT
jgi:serine protease